MTKFSSAIFLTLFLLVLTFLTFSQLGTVLNLKALDVFQISHSPHPDIVILAIDNKSLQKIGRWPWSRTVHSRIIDKLNTVNPTALGIDIIFSESEKTEVDSQLAKSLSGTKFPVVLASQALFFNRSTNPQKLLLPLDQLKQSPNVSVGHVNLLTSEDGLTRNLPIPLMNNQSIPFSFQLAKAINTQLPSGAFLVNFAGKAGVFPTYSISDFLEGSVTNNKLTGKIILIGATASDLHDTVLIPKGEVLSGIEYNANILDNLLLQKQITLLSNIFTFLIGIFILISYIFLRKMLKPKFMTMLLVASILILPLVSLILWHTNIALFYLSNIILVILLILYHGIYHWYLSEQDKRKLRQTFQHYFSPSVLEEILKNPDSLKLGGQKKEVTILFSDIRSFTTITESLPPEKLTELLHEYFTEMSSEILATDGVLDKFIGDAIMAFWGAPVEQKDHADRAIKAATSMIKRLKVLKKKWLRQGLPEINAGVGINSGIVTVGNMGSSDRFDYTVIGDAVNAASRLESLNKEYKTNIIISEDTKNKLIVKIKTRSLGQVLVKGKTKPLKIYKVIV